MRIATSTLYSQQLGSIDNLESSLANIGNELTTQKKLNVPSDDPGQIALDLSLHNTLASQNQLATNITSATGQLTQTDSTLASLTSLLQSANTLAVQAANGTNTASDLSDEATQAQSLLQQAINLANTNVDGTFIFAGSANPTTAPVTAVGNPPTGVAFNGNFESQSVTVNNQQVPVSTSLQAAFNVDAADGSPSVFQTLINLADTLSNGTVVDQSATAINTPGQTIQGAGAAAPSTLANAPFAVPIVADSTGNVSISINNAGPNGTQHVETYTFAVSPPAAPPATAIDDGTPASIVGQINANTAVTGLSAAFDTKTQRLILTNASGGSFDVTDIPSPGATTTGNFTSVFGLTGQADVESTLSTQIGDIQNTLNVTLNARAVLGSQLNTLSSLGSQNSTNVVDTTQQESQIEDVNVAQATSQFTQTQTALDAAFATTTRLEGKTLFDFLSG